ncbi:MAG TPA: 6-phosphogluconolactonase [Minicystis sp.]|nr:6-phosphogluconolactonase [Minicystis sp.]
MSTSRAAGPNLGEVLVAASPEEHAALAAELFARAIQEAVDTRGVARVALSGGSTPRPAHHRLAEQALPFDKLRVYQVDERAVPPTHPRSNFGALLQDFGVALGESDGPTKKGRLHRMRGDAPSLAAAAEDYARLLRAEFGVASAVAFDVVGLGIGDDGHTASLFPRLGVVGIDDRLVIDVPAQPDKGLEPRISFTAPVICEARLVVVLVRGAEKRAVIEKARAAGPEEDVPSRLVQRAKGRVVWLVDRAAAPG